eukprot:scaffold1671_cov344-Pavlova_lutheri.AAC.29
MQLAIPADAKASMKRLRKKARRRRIGPTETQRKTVGNMMGSATPDLHRNSVRAMPVQAAPGGTAWRGGSVPYRRSILLDRATVSACSRRHVDRGLGGSEVASAGRSSACPKIGSGPCK